MAKDMGSTKAPKQSGSSANAGPDFCQGEKGIKGMASVDNGATRSSCAPTPKTLSGRDA